MSTDNKPVEPKMPGRPEAYSPVTRTITSAAVLLTGFASFGLFTTMFEELNSYSPNNSRATGLALLAMLLLGFSAVCLYSLAARSHWHYYASRAEQEFAELQAAHNALKGETAAYRKARDTALEQRQLAEEEALAAIEEGVIQAVVAYEVPKTVPDDKPAN